MSSSQRTLVVYPNSTSAQPLNSNEKGSFGPLIAVVSVILVLTVAACIIGHFCARRYLRPRPRRDQPVYYSKDDLEGLPESRSPAAAAGGGIPAGGSAIHGAA
ncbi:hypothetical protein MA16_Dca013355 [Dendrobium catenatum]|uniref:Uncharacterized protein n=1 Tax=Dendrobium catenatum TaxID=906689 RepID=A0A2I0VIS5_9ASPA|nr:hypothetical protein MA16_Dca013355 [Dendrobium catenatum]